MLIRLALILIFTSLNVQALEGISPLEKQISENNHELISLKLQKQAKEQTLNSAYRSFYPSLTGVLGWGEDRLTDPQNQSKGSFAYLEGQLNIFRGQRDQLSVEKKQFEAQIAGLDYEKSRRNIKQYLVEVFSEMLYLHRLQHILFSESLITAEQKKMAAKKVSSGLTSSVDNLELDLREQEIQIQTRQINGLHQESHQKLIEIFGEDLQDEALDSIDFEDINNLSKIKDFSNEANVDVQRARAYESLSQIELQETKGEFFPNLDFNYSLGRITPTDNSSANLNEEKYSLKLTIPIFSGFENIYKKRSAAFENQAKKQALAQTEIAALSSYNVLASKIRELADLYRINEIRMTTAKKYFDLTEAEYKRGIKNSPDLVNATDRWFSSQKRKFELLKELELTKVKIENLQ